MNMVDISKMLVMGIPGWYVGRDGVANGVQPELSKLSWGKDDSLIIEKVNMKLYEMM